jgi:hypothetical protein
MKASPVCPELQSRFVQVYVELPLPTELAK